MIKRWEIDKAIISKMAYAKQYGPTVGYRVRTDDSDLLIDGQPYETGKG